MVWLLMSVIPVERNETVSLGEDNMSYMNGYLIKVSNLMDFDGFYWAAF